MSPAPTPRAAQLRLFTPAGITVGTALGSLIAGVAMLWFNYRVLGYPSLGNRIAAAGTVFYLMVLVAASMAPNTPTIGAAVMLGQCAIAWWGSRTLQGDAIEYHVARGGGVHGMALSALVGLAVGLVAVSILLLVGRISGLPIAIR